MRRHHATFEVIERDLEGYAICWTATCGCGRQWTGPDLVDVEPLWEQHAIEAVEAREANDG